MWWRSWTHAHSQERNTQHILNSCVKSDSIKCTHWALYTSSSRPFPARPGPSIARLRSHWRDRHFFLIKTHHFSSGMAECMRVHFLSMSWMKICAKSTLAQRVNDKTTTPPPPPQHSRTESAVSIYITPYFFTPLVFGSLYLSPSVQKVQLGIFAHILWDFHPKTNIHCLTALFFFPLSKYWICQYHFAPCVFISFYCAFKYNYTRKILNNTNINRQNRQGKRQKG